MKKLISLTLIIILTFSLLGCDKKSSSGKKEPNYTYYILNRNSKVYHDPGCKYLPAEKNQVEIKYDDIEHNPEYRPCGHCKPK